MALTDTALRAVKPGDKAQKLFDGKGLFMLVSPNGTKAWRFKYQFHGREKLISLGLYPTVSLRTPENAPNRPARRLKAVLTRQNSVNRKKSPTRTLLNWLLWNGMSNSATNGAKHTPRPTFAA